jgi:hypothetical protein
MEKVFKVQCSRFNILTLFGLRALTWELGLRLWCSLGGLALVAMSVSQPQRLLITESKLKVTATLPITE